MSSTPNGTSSPVRSPIRSPPPYSIRSPAMSPPIRLRDNLTLEQRFAKLESLIAIGPTLFEGKSINSELLFDVLCAVYYECQRYVFVSCVSYLLVILIVESSQRQEINHSKSFASSSNHILISCKICI